MTITYYHKTMKIPSWNILFRRSNSKYGYWIMRHYFSQTSMKKYKTNYQLVSPHIHRDNYVERAIQIFFLNQICIGFVGSNFYHLWIRFSSWSIILTLNLLRSAISNIKLSAHAFSMDSLISIQLPFLHREPKSLLIPNQPTVPHGTLMERKDVCVLPATSPWSVSKLWGGGFPTSESYSSIT